jgi:single-strand DNA-binding protein
MYQQIMLIGNLGDDPELRYTAGNLPVCTFRMAVNKQWVGSDGEKNEQTLWFRVSTWRKQAEVVSQYLRQGRKVLVIGEVKSPNAYINRHGEPAASLEVTAHSVRFLDIDHGTAPDDDAGPEAAVPTVQGRLPVEMDIPV